MNEPPLVVRPVGELDGHDCTELRRLLRSTYDSPFAVIDLSAARYMDTKCLTELASLRAARMLRGHLPARLVIADPNIRRLFAIVRFDAIFEVYETVEDAVSLPNG